VVERPRVGNRCLNTQFNLDIIVDKNGDRAGPFRGIIGTLEWKGEESVVAILKFSMWYPSPVLVKDRGVGIREQVLNVSITCQ
jgi:hypothetical protein